MATRRFGLSVGEILENVTEAVGAATVADTVELTVDLANTIVTDFGVSRTISKIEVLLILNMLTQYIERVQWPPA